MRDFHFSIEIELTNLTTGQAARAIQRTHGGEIHDRSGERGATARVIDRQGRTWDAIPTAGCGAPRVSIITPPLPTEQLLTSLTFLEALDEAGAAIDERCGFHIAVDARDLDARAVVNLIRLAHAHEQLLRHALGVTRARHFDGCRYLSPAFVGLIEATQPRTLAALETAWFGEGTPVPEEFDPMRGCGLDLSELWTAGRIQIRYFHATFDPDKIEAILLVAQRLVATALETPVIEPARPRFCAHTAREDFRALLGTLGLSGDALEFAEEELFAGPPADMQPQAQAA